MLYLNDVASSATFLPSRLIAALTLTPVSCRDRFIASRAGCDKSWKKRSYLRIFRHKSTEHMWASVTLILSGEFLLDVILCGLCRLVYCLDDLF